MQTTVIKQLKKALACKDDKELRLRVEVLLEILEENQVRTPVSAPQAPTQMSVPQVAQPRRNPFMGGGEEITYTRPKGT